MSACFVWISHESGLKPTLDAHLNSRFDAWVPFVAEERSTWVHPSGQASMWCWETHREGVRGGHWVNAQDQSSALSMTGWWREPDAAPLSLSVAEVMFASLWGRRVSTSEAQGYERGLSDYAPIASWETLAQRPSELSTSGGSELSNALSALHLSPGQFAAVLCDSAGVVHGVNSAFGGSPLYYGQGQITVNGTRSQVAIVSNRSSLISLCFNGGKPAPPRPEVLGWLLARSEHPIGDQEVPFTGVNKVHAGQRLQLSHAQVSVHPLPLPEARQFSHQALFESLIWRSGQLARYPDLTLKMAITGGFDSRLVLAGLIGAGLTDRIDEYYICAHQENADAQVATEIAEWYKLPFTRYESGRWQAVNEPLLDRLRRHNFLIEYLCSAWDIISGPESLKLEDYSLISGHYGELYRGHAKRFFSHTWPTLKWYYQSNKGIDRHSLLTKSLIDRYAQLSKAWFKKRSEEGIKSNLALDDLHRHTRMEGWATQCRQVEALSLPSFAPLACVSSRAHYEALSLAERERPSVHFALTRMADEDLWRFPFAKKGWPKSLTQGERETPSPPSMGGGTELGYQMKLWRAEADQVSSWLLDRSPQHALWLICDRQKLERKLNLARSRPNAQIVKSIMCVCALKLALDEPLSPAQFSR